MSRPGLAEDLRIALGGSWDGPPVYLVVPATLTLETERAVFAATGLKGSFRLQVVDWNGLARGVLRSAGRSIGTPLTQDIWRLLVTSRLRLGRFGTALLPGLERRIADTLWDAILTQPSAPRDGLGDVFQQPDAELLNRLLSDLEPALGRLAHPARVAREASVHVREVAPTVFILEDPEPNPFRDILGPAVDALSGVRTFSYRELLGDSPGDMPLESGVGLAIYQAAHPLAEAWLAVARVRDLLASGEEPSGIAVTSPRIRTYAPHLSRAFSEAAVAADVLLPVGRGGAEARLVRALLRLGRQEGAERRRIVGDIASTGLLPRVTEAVLPRRRKTADLERLTRDGAGVLASLVAFGRGFPEDKPLAEHLGHLARLLDEERVPPEVARRADAKAWDAIMDAMREAAHALGDLPLSSELARDLLGAAVLGAKPAQPIPHHGAVRVVELEQALAAPAHHLFVLGLADRSFAGPTRRGLSPREGAPADHPLMRLWRERQAWDQTLSDRLRRVNAKTLSLSFPVDNGEGGRSEPALLVAEAAERFPQCVVPVSQDPVAEALSKPDLAASLARTIAERRRLARPAAFEESLAGRLASLGGMGEALLSLVPSGVEENLAPDVAKRLFGRFSASSLEARAACPTKHLAQALGLQSEADDPFDLTRWGQRAHQVLEDLMREVMEDGSPPAPDTLAERARELALSSVEEEADGLLAGKRRDALAELLAISVERAAREIGRDLEANGFMPLRTETRFGPEVESSVTLSVAGDDVPLVGRIDRIDRRSDGALRLVDYKTGKARIDYAKLYHGLDVQLALYAVAADAMGLGRTVRLALWPVPAARVRVALPDGKAARHPERPDEIDLEKEPGARALLARTIGIASDLAAEAHSGVIAPRPVRLGRHLACDACSLLPVCRAEAPDVRRLPAMGKRDVVAAFTEAEA